MKTKQILLITTILLIAFFSSSCAGGSSTVASGWASVTTDGETAYLAYNSFIHAINLNNGSERWHYPDEADAKITFYAAPTLTDDGQLIAGGYDNVLYSLNPENGSVNWTFTEAEGRFVGSTLASEDKLYAPSADHFLYAINTTGTAAWASPFESTEPLWAKPAIDTNCGCIYLPSMDHKVYAIEAASGDLIWATGDLGGAIVGVPVVSDDQIVYIGTFDNEMIALDAKTGHEIWRFKTENWVWSGPALEGDFIYFGDLSGTLYAVDRLSGAAEWQIQPDGAIVGTPLIIEDSLYFTTEEGSLVATSLEGVIRWNQPIAEQLHGGPIAAGEAILVATSNPESLLIATDASGVQKWSFGLQK